MRAFVPHMASHYGFDFEFVTYKWPSWLHKQTEKQRIIWAYKILFLDVLFPLDLKKVIFLVRLYRPSFRYPFIILVVFDHTCVNLLL